MEGRPDGDVERALATFGGISLRYFSFGSVPVRAPGYAGEPAADEYAGRHETRDAPATVAPDPYIPGPQERASEVFPLIGQAVPEASQVHVEPHWSLLDSAYGETEYSARSEADVPPELASGPAMSYGHAGAPMHAAPPADQPPPHPIESFAAMPPPAPQVHIPQTHTPQTHAFEPPAFEPHAAEEPFGEPPLAEPPLHQAPPVPPPTPLAVSEPVVEPVRSNAVTPPRSFGVRPSAAAMPSWPQRPAASPPPAVEEAPISPHAHEDMPAPERIEAHPVGEHEPEALPHNETAAPPRYDELVAAPPHETPHDATIASPLDMPEQHETPEHREAPDGFMPAAAVQPSRHAETVSTAPPPAAPVAGEEPAIDDLIPLASYAAPEASDGEPAVAAPPAAPDHLLVTPEDEEVPPPRGRRAGIPPMRPPLRDQSAALGGLFRPRRAGDRAAGQTPPAPPPGSDALQDVFRRL